MTYNKREIYTVFGIATVVFLYLLLEIAFDILDTPIATNILFPLIILPAYHIVFASINRYEEQVFFPFSYNFISKNIYVYYWATIVQMILYSIVTIAVFTVFFLIQVPFVDSFSIENLSAYAIFTEFFSLIIKVIPAVFICYSIREFIIDFKVKPVSKTLKALGVKIGKYALLAILSVFSFWYMVFWLGLVYCGPLCDSNTQAIVHIQFTLAITGFSTYFLIQYLKKIIIKKYF